MNLSTINDTLSTKVWGQHSLSIGNLVTLVIGVALILWKPLGSWSMWVALAVIFVGMALF